MHSSIKPPSRPRRSARRSPCNCRRAISSIRLKALEMGQPGDIIVVDAGGDTEVSVCGGLMGGLAKNRGIRGMIVDGAGRDIDELEDIGWPIWTRAITARGTHTMFSGRKEELSINVAVTCGGVVVQPGRLRRCRHDRRRRSSRWPRPRRSWSWRGNRPSASRRRASGCRRERPSRTCWPSSAGSRTAKFPRNVLGEAIVRFGAFKT